MNIHEFYYNENNECLNVDFSLSNDNDFTYRSLSLTFNEIEYYSPTLIDEKDMKDIDEIYVSEILFEYFKENIYPEEKLL